ncbi:MAG: hypothetical protein Q9159_006970 [Coniocarpon cinnabarinum]
MHEPIEQRAWTLEERLLSPRLINFSSVGPIWQCRSRTQVFERRAHFLDGAELRMVSQKRSSIKGHLGYFTQAIPSLWLHVVENYTGRKLTHAEDKLVAICGIVDLFAEAWGTELGVYTAGVWSNYVAEGLLWHTRSFNKLVRPEARRAPSWSWASVDSQVYFGRLEHSYKKTSITAVSLENQFLDENLHSEICCVILECPIIGAELTQDGDIRIDTCRSPSVDELYVGWQEDAVGERCFNFPKQVQLLLLLIDAQSEPMYQGIVAAETKQGAERYQRLGWFCAGRKRLRWLQKNFGPLSSSTRNPRHSRLDRGKISGYTRWTSARTTAEAARYESILPLPTRITLF